MYVAHRLNKVDEGVEGFDANMLILHVLHFAYREVWYTFAGQLPRPIWVPDYGVVKGDQSPTEAS